jgi:hypothetical protein
MLSSGWGCISNENASSENSNDGGMVRIIDESGGEQGNGDILKEVQKSNLVCDDSNPSEIEDYSTRKNGWVGKFVDSDIIVFLNQLKITEALWKNGIRNQENEEPLKQKTDTLKGKEVLELDTFLVLPRKQQKEVYQLALLSTNNFSLLVEDSNLGFREFINNKMLKSEGTARGPRLACSFTQVIASQEVPIRLKAFAEMQITGKAVNQDSFVLLWRPWKEENDNKLCGDESVSALKGLNAEKALSILKKSGWSALGTQNFKLPRIAYVNSCPIISE